MNAIRKPAVNNSGRFKKGNEPWNKGVSVHLSPATEFRKGQKPVNKLIVGTIRVRVDKQGKQRAWMKVAEPNVWKLRAVVFWEYAHGPVPAGKLIHHRDRDTLNDDLSNLELLDRAAHLNEHRSEFKKQAANRA